MLILQEVLKFLPWCWAINMSLTVLGFLVRSSPLLARYDAPLDGGRTLPDGHRVIGDSSTLGGVLAVMMLGIAGFLVTLDAQYLVLALLVKAGDMLGSFIKRRLGFASGTFVPLIDHGDYVIVAGIYMLAQGRISPEAFFVAWASTLALTPIVTVLAWRIGVRKRPL